MTPYRGFWASLLQRDGDIRTVPSLFFTLTPKESEKQGYLGPYYGGFWGLTEGKPSFTDWASMYCEPTIGKVLC